MITLFKVEDEHGLFTKTFTVFMEAFEYADKITQQGHICALIPISYITLPSGDA